MTTKPKAGATVTKPAPKRTGPTAAAKRNAVVMAKICGGTVVEVGRRCTVHTGRSQKLAKVMGSVECRGSTVTMVLFNVTPLQAGAMLLLLIHARGAWKKRGWSAALDKFFTKVEKKGRR
jgi:hypothetical protein